MAEVSKTPQLERAAAQAAARVAPRGKSVDRRFRILERLTIGLSIAHITGRGAADGATRAQMIAQVLASREIDPSGGFVQLPIARLSEAVIVARTMMVEGNLQAMDRWIELMSELDRYHDLALAQAPRRRRRLASPDARAPLDLAESGRRRVRREIFRLANP